jgi:hypothetical protein
MPTLKTFTKLTIGIEVNNAKMEYGSYKFYLRVPDEIRLISRRQSFTQYTTSIHIHGIENLVQVVCGETEHELWDNLEKFNTQYRKETTTVRKVILFKTNYSSFNNCEDYERTKLMYATMPAKLKFEYHIADEIDEGKHYSYEDSKTKINIARKRKNEEGEWEIIPWTTEAEEFFISIYDGMEMLMKKMKKFIGTGKRAQKSIATKQKLLGNNNETTKKRNVVQQEEIKKTDIQSSQKS